MKATFFCMLFASLFVAGCVTEKQFLQKKSDLKFSIVEGCDGEEEFSITASIENENLVTLVRAPLTCGLQTVNPQYTRWGKNNLITLSVETYYDGGSLASCYCWRTMRFEFPAEDPVLNSLNIFPTKIYFVQDKTVMGDNNLNVAP